MEMYGFSHVLLSVLLMQSINFKIVISRNPEIFSIMQDVVSHGNTELSFISDFKSNDQNVFLKMMNKYEYGVTVFTPQNLYDKYEKRELCPIHGLEVSPNITYPTFRIHENEIYIRKQVIPSLRYHKTIFIWINDTTNLEIVLKMMSNSVMDYCDEKFDRGLYHSESRIFFYVQGKKEMEIIFNENRVKNHPKVSVIRQIPGTLRLMFYTFNIFRGKYEPKFVWSSENKIKRVSDVFPSFKNFNKYQLKIASLPYSHHVNADERDPNTDPLYAENNIYKNHWGFEIELLNELAKLHNFEYKMYNPPDGLWGSVEADGKWSGLIEYAKSGVVDIVISDILQNYPRRLVIDGTFHFENDYLVSLAPNPVISPQYFAFVSPFHLSVWIGIIGSIGLLSIIFVIVSRIESSIIDVSLTDWSILRNSGWYTYGTLIGESMTRDTKTSGINALRSLIGAWIIYCLVIMSAYGGELKAYLTTPVYTKPVESLKDILDSGLPWGLVLYGELEEKMMAKSQDPIVKIIWENKIVVDYTPLANVEPVFDGKFILIDWRSGLSPVIATEFSTPRGDPLVYMSSSPIFMNNYSGWALNPLNPWRVIFDEFIMLCKEVGLIEEWIKKTWRKMNVEFLASGKKRKKVKNLRSAASPLTLNDTQGIFYLFLFMLLISIFIFFIEFRYIHRKKY